MPTKGEEYSELFLSSRLAALLAEEHGNLRFQKVSGANILFFGFGDGTTGQFEYADEENWKLSISKGEIE